MGFRTPTAANPDTETHHNGSRGNYHWSFSLTRVGSVISPLGSSEHWRFTFSLPRECALARTRAKVGPWRVVEGVTALLRRNGLAEQAGEEVGSPKSRRRAAVCTAPKNRRRAAGCTAHTLGPPKPRKTQPGLPRKAATARVGWVGPTRRLRARALARWVQVQESRRGLEVGRGDVQAPFLRH